MPALSHPAAGARLPIGFGLAWPFLMAAMVAVVVAWSGAVQDDAYISFRYAFHLVEGDGLVFNPGERVEGFTSLLWTLMAAVFIAAGLEPAPLAQLVAVLCNLGLAGMAYRLARLELGHPPAVALLTPMFLVANLNLGAWAAHGMESSLFALLLLVAWSIPPRLRGERSSWSVARALLCGSSLALATTVRPEGVLYAGLTSLVILFPRRRLGFRRGLLAYESSSLLLPFVLPVTLLLLWRQSYYGYWLPNTFYAKATQGAGTLEEGLRYLGRFSSEVLLGGLLVLPLLGLVRRLGQGPRPLFVTVVLGTVAYVALIGGDAFAGARFFIPVLVPLYLLVQDGLYSGLRRRALVGLPTALLALFLGIATVAQTGPPVARQAELAASMTRNRVFLGKLLQDLLPDDYVLAVNTVGALPYHARHRTLDLYGLTNTHIARQQVRQQRRGGTGHEKGDGAYVLAQRPDLILLRNVWLADIPIEEHRALFGVSEHEIAASPEFERQYQPVNLRLSPSLIFGFYLRADRSALTLEQRFAELVLESYGPLEALTAERGMERILFESGNRLRVVGRGSAAIRSYEQALELYPDEGDVHQALAETLEEAGDLERAREHFRRATELMPERAAGWFGLGNVEARLGRPPVAIRAYQRAVRLDPNRVDAYANLAGQLLKEGRYQDAIPVLRNGVVRAPRDLELWIRLGTAAGMIQRWREAREALERAQALAPEDPRTRAYAEWVGARLPR